MIGVTCVHDLGESVLKKLTATGILAGAATGVVLFAGPAHASRLAAVSDLPAACDYTTTGYVPPAWCADYLPNPYAPPVAYAPPPAYYPPVTVYPPAPYYPGYNYGWHHGGHPHHWHR